MSDRDLLYEFNVSLAGASVRQLTRLARDSNAGAAKMAQEELKRRGATLFSPTKRNPIVKSARTGLARARKGLRGLGKAGSRTRAVGRFAGKNLLKIGGGTAAVGGGAMAFDEVLDELEQRFEELEANTAEDFEFIGGAGIQMNLIRQVGNGRLAKLAAQRGAQGKAAREELKRRGVQLADRATQPLRTAVKDRKMAKRQPKELRGNSVGRANKRILVEGGKLAAVPAGVAGVSAGGVAIANSGGRKKKRS